MANIQDLINSIKEVPAMPNVIIKALSIVKDPEAGAKELAGIISCDQSLSTKVLSLVNSAYYGFPQQITSINRALALLGMMKAKNIIVTVAMRPLIISQGDKTLWEHSIKTAVASEHIAKYLKLMDPDEAFVIGFLHDIGKIVLNIQSPEYMEKIRQLVQDGSNSVEAEQMFFETDHTQMGSLLAKKWQLPILLNNVIKYHHQPEMSSMPSACSLVQLADMLVYDGQYAEEIKQVALKALNLNIEEPQILRETIGEKASVLLAELSS